MSKLQFESLGWVLIFAMLVTGQGCGSADFESELDPGFDDVASAGPDPDVGTEAPEPSEDDDVLPGDFAGVEGAGGFGGSAGDLGPQMFPCTEQGIRDAIAEGGGPHLFDCDGSQTVITEKTIEVDRDVVLDAEDRLTIDANGRHRVFAVASDVTVAFVGMTVTGGTVGRDDALSYGGGIHNEGNLTLASCSVVHNAAAYDGGGIYNSGSLTLKNTTVSDNAVGLVDPGLDNAIGGGIANVGDLTIVGGIVSGNTATMYGGGIYDRGTTTITDSAISNNEASLNGGGIYSRGELTLANTTVTDNGSRGDSGGGIFSTGTLTLVGSTVSRNGGFSAIDSSGPLTLTDSAVSSNEGDGVDARGTATVTNSSIWGNSRTGLRSFQTTLTVIGSTVSGNGWDGIRASGTTALVNSTVSGNTSDDLRHGAGTLALVHTTLRGTLTLGSWDEALLVELKGALIDGSCSTIGDSVTYGSFGHNVESPGDTCGFDHATDHVNVIRDRLLLGPLADNGGPTLTHAPQPNSMAIDAIPGEDCADIDGAAMTIDQRGLPRNATCDVGAVELQR